MKWLPALDRLESSHHRERSDCHSIAFVGLATESGHEVAVEHRSAAAIRAEMRMFNKNVDGLPGFQKDSVDTDCIGFVEIGDSFAVEGHSADRKLDFRGVVEEGFVGRTFGCNRFAEGHSADCNRFVEEHSVDSKSAEERLDH